MSSQSDLLDLQFIEMRHLVVELAAFLDRMERAPGPADARIDALRTAIRILNEPAASRAKAVLDSLSDRSDEPTQGIPGPPACGAPIHTKP